MTSCLMDFTGQPQVRGDFMKQLKPNYNMNDLMDDCISRFEDTFLLLRDTPDFLPQSVLDKIVAGISKEMNRMWKRLRKYDKSFQRKLMDKKTLFQRFGQPRPMTANEPPQKEPAPQLQENLPQEAPKKEVSENVK